RNKSRRRSSHAGVGWPIGWIGARGIRSINPSTALGRCGPDSPILTSRFSLVQTLHVAHFPSCESSLKAWLGLPSLAMSASGQIRERRLLAYSVEKLENALAAFSCQAESRSPVRPVNRRRVKQKALGGAQYEVASAPTSEMRRSP